MFADVVDNIKSTYIADSQVHGYGLFCENKIPTGNILVCLDGQIIPWDLHEKLNLTSEWNALPDNRLLVRPYKTKYYFINHSRTPNVEVVRKDDEQLQVMALRDLVAGEELTLDYRKEPLSEAYKNGHGATYL